MWMFNYLKDEFNITIHREPILKEINGKIFLIGHGDGLGPGDRKYKFVKRFSPIKYVSGYLLGCTPNFSFSIAHYWSKKKSRKGNAW